MSRSLMFSVLLTCLYAPWAHAGPPFFTDDPEPVPYKNAEFYTFSTVDHTPDETGVAGPAFEFNVGAAPNLQLHIVAPLQLSAPTHGPITYGIGDMELGAKYRFIQEKGARPQVGTFPMIEVPTGNSRRGLGNGEAWYKLPIWVQKSFGHGWQSYGGGGYIVNPAPGMRNTAFFGWQLQKELNKKLTVGGEWFNPGRQSFATGNTHILNFGGMYNFYKNASLLFTAGHSVQGDSHTVAYVALYWTFGKKPEEEHEAEKEAKPSGLSSLLHHP
jgi:hypothetical protein